MFNAENTLRTRLVANRNFDMLPVDLKPECLMVACSKQTNRSDLNTP